MDVLHDLRPASAFRAMTFCKYQRVAVKRELLASLVKGKVEPACHWAAELVCSGLFEDLWEMCFLFFAKHVHLANPKLVLYLELRVDAFRALAESEVVELNLRNVEAVRKLVAELMGVLCASPQKFACEARKVDAADFNLQVLHTKLRAPRGDFARLDPGDPAETRIPFNELAYALSAKRALDACYWLEWVLEFERACAKKKSKCVAAARPYVANRKDLVWIFWDVVFAALTDAVRTRLARATLRLYTVQYSPTQKESRRFLLYFAVALCCEPMELVDLAVDKSAVEAVVRKAHLAYKDRVGQCVS